MFVRTMYYLSSLVAGAISCTIGSWLILCDPDYDLRRQVGGFVLLVSGGVILLLAMFNYFLP